MEKNGLLDILLLPKNVFLNLTNKKTFLYFGIIFVGFSDLIFSLLDNRVMVFGGKSAKMLNYNLGMVILFTLILGFVDILFFALPMFDFFKFLKKDGPLFSNTNLIRFTKSYILAHFIVIPVNGIFYWLMYNEQTTKTMPSFLFYTAIAYTFFIMPVWFSGIVSRGANLIFDIDATTKPLAFAVIFAWNFILSTYAFSYIINHWVMWFFR